MFIPLLRSLDIFKISGNLNNSDNIYYIIVPLFHSSKVWMNNMWPSLDDLPKTRNYFSITDSVKMLFNKDYYAWFDYYFIWSFMVA